MNQSVQDLNILLQKLGYNKVHLFGHSFGGGLAYEFAQQHSDQLQSLILGNAASNMKVAGDAYDRLARSTPNFWTTNVCKVVPSHPALDNALQHVGSVWAGMDVVIDYKALPFQTTSIPKTLIINSRDDFGAEASRGWKDLLSTAEGGDKKNIVEEHMFENSAHYPHLEEPTEFGRVLDDFMSKND